MRSRAPVGDRKFEYSVQPYAVRDGAWQAVRQSGSLNLMPDEELQTYELASKTMEAQGRL